MAQPIFRIPGFPTYLTGRALVGLINRGQVIAVGYHIYEITNDPIALGYIGISIFLPIVGFGLIAGDIADRVNRALVLTFGMSIAAVSSAGLLALALTDVQVAWPFYVCTALFGTALAITRPALPSFIAQIVPPAQLSNAIATASGISQVSNIIGPAAVGGLLIAGPAVAYAVLMAIAIVGAILWIFLRPYAVRRVAEQTGLSTIKRIAEGVLIVVHTPLILGVMSLDLFAVFFGSVVALLPVFARDILLIGPGGLGLLRAAPAVGGAIMAVLLARVTIRKHAGPIMLTGVAAFGVATLVFGLSRNLTLSLIALAASGAADVLSNVLRNTTIQLSVPDAVRGRVSSVSQVFVSGSNELGDFRAGVSAGLLGTLPAVMIGGVGTIAVAALWSWIFPSLRKLDRLSDLAGHSSEPANSEETARAR